MDLTGRVALVTGGTRGIGLGITRALLDAGATVVTCSRSDVEPVGGSAHLVCDVRDPDAVRALVDEVVAAHGRLDVLVNNAGRCAVRPGRRRLRPVPRPGRRAQPARRPSPVAQAANAVMQRQETGGSIVNISSRRRRCGPPRAPPRTAPRRPAWTR